jgi:biopolymer transport protein TolQ
MPTNHGAGPNVFDLVLGASAVVQFVIFVLLFGSVLSWAIIIWKSRTLRKATRENRQFLELFWRSRSLDDFQARQSPNPPSPMGVIFASGYKELQRLPAPSRGSAPPGVVENVSRALARAATAQIAEMERGVGWLATVANASPFIGLFGTVWGIMYSFQGIAARGSASLAVVAPGISEALIATAAGLGAAIPAVVAYNHFVAQIRRQGIELEGFSQELLNIVQNGFLGEGRE